MCDGRSLWVDQICIDQTQMKERGHQVGIMEHIYRGAEETLCWLGQDPTNGLAFSVMPRMIHDYRLNRQDPKRLHYVDKIDPWKWLSGAENNAFRAMAASSYWTRHWIVQEILLSAKVVLLYGSSTVPFANLADVCVRDLSLPPRFRSPVQDTSMQYILGLAKLLARPEFARQEPRDVRDLWFNVSAIVHRTSCLDDRDKVYGIQSLFPLELRIHVDYSLTTEAVWVEMIVLWFKRCPHVRLAFQFPSIYFAKGMGLSLDKIRAVLSAKISTPMKAQGAIDEEVDYQEILDHLEDKEFLDFWDN
jgi:hypothetical protein